MHVCLHDMLLICEDYLLVTYPCPDLTERINLTTELTVCFSFQGIGKYNVLACLTE